MNVCMHRKPIAKPKAGHPKGFRVATKVALRVSRGIFSWTEVFRSEGLRCAS